MATCNLAQSMLFTGSCFFSVQSVACCNTASNASDLLIVDFQNRKDMHNTLEGK